MKLRYPEARSVLDAFGGAAGNTIQFVYEFDQGMSFYCLLLLFVFYGVPFANKDQFIMWNYWKRMSNLP